ncbi:MAG: DUF5018 domain-containing protein [bacterium]
MKKIFAVSLTIFLLSLFVFPSLSFGASSENLITHFAFTSLNPIVEGVIDNNSIALTVPTGTNVTALSPTIITSPYATVSPASGTPQDFTNGVAYTVTAENGTTKDYTAVIFFRDVIPSGMTVTMKPPTNTSVTFMLSGFPFNKEISFDVINYNVETPDYTDYQTSTTDNTGKTSFQFNGLSPGGHYQYSHSEAPNEMGSFWTTGTAGSKDKTNLSTSGGGLTAPCPEDGCGFNELMIVINKVINFIIFVMAVPIAAIMFAYAGFMLVTSGGASEQRTKAKGIFVSVAIGLALAAACWLIVHTLLSIVGYNGSWIGL